MAGEDEEDKPISVQLREMKAFLGKKIDEGHSKLEASVSSLSGRMDRNEAEMQRQKLSTNLAIESLKAGLNDIKSRANLGAYNANGNAASYAETAGRAAVPVRCHRSDQLATQYWNSRQSARISPIDGDGEEEIWAGLQRFFFEKMRIPQTDLRQSDILNVRRVLTARGRKSRLEVCVKFLDLETKDRVGSYAKNLGEYIENGKATATFRHEIPSHLTGVHRTLLNMDMILGRSMAVDLGEISGMMMPQCRSA